MNEGSPWGWAVMLLIAAPCAAAQWIWRKIRRRA